MSAHNNDGTTLARVKAFIADELSVPTEKIDDDATMDALGFDSLDAIGLMVELDTTFRVELPDYDPEKGGAMTPRSIAADVDRLVAENAGPHAMVPL